MAQKILDLTGANGLSDRFWGDTHRETSQPNLRYDASDGQMVEGIYNPLLYRGYLSPSNNSFLTLTIPTITGSWFSGFIEPDTASIYFGNEDQHVYSDEESFTHSAVVYTYEPYDVVKLQDEGDVADDQITNFCVYQINEVKKIFYVHDDEIGVASITFGTPDSDYFRTLTTGGFALNTSTGDAFLRVADNGFLYIFDQWSVHKLDGTSTGGTTGTATQDVLLFPQDMFRIVDAVDNRGLMFIGLNSEGTFDPTVKTNFQIDESRCGVYLWDRLSTAVRMRDYVAIEGAQAILRLWIHSDSTLHAMTVGSNGLTQIRRFNGNTFDIIKELPKQSRISVKDSLTIAEGMTVWAGIDGYVYGLDVKGSIFKLCQYTTGTLDADGGTVLLYAGGNSFDASASLRADRASLYIAYKLTGENAIVKRWFFYGLGTLVDNNGAGGQAYISNLPFVANIGNVYTPVYYMPFLATVKTLSIYCAPGTTSDSTTVATIKIYYNQSSTATVTKVVTKADVAKGYVLIDLNKPYVNAVQIEIEWDTSLVMGTDDFLPSIGILNYEPTNAHSPSIS